MGEIADMIRDGTLCRVCGCLLEDLIVPGSRTLKEAPGHPRTCQDCRNERVVKRNYSMIMKRRKRR